MSGLAYPVFFELTKENSTANRVVRRESAPFGDAGVQPWMNNLMMCIGVVRAEEGSVVAEQLVKSHLWQSWRSIKRGIDKDENDGD